MSNPAGVAVRAGSATPHTDYALDARIEKTTAEARFRRRGAPKQADDASVTARAIARGKAGDPEAIRYLYGRYADDVYGYVCGIVRDEHEAEDITQTVFAKLMTVLCKYEQRSVPFSAWILRVARNVAVDHVRSQRAIPCAEVRDPDVHDTDGDNQRALCLRNALASLPAQQRHVLVLRHVAGLTPDEIAERLGKTGGSIHALHHRGRRAVQVELRKAAVAPATMRGMSAPAVA